MHGSLRLGLSNESLKISSRWSGLTNPELDPRVVEGGVDGIANHPSTRMRNLREDDEEAWAKIRIDAKDWGKVMSVGRMDSKVIACE